MVGKNFFLGFLIFTFLLVLSGCTDSSENEIQSTVGGLTITEVSLGNLTFNQIEGRINTDLTFTSDKMWLMNGAITVEEGATLTIEPGTTVYAAFNDLTSYLAVQRGAKIIADGTADAPIYFTTIRELTSIPQPGDWGGLIINGRAPINLPSGQGEGEGGTGTYGGTDPDDDSGILRYVVVSYAGKQLGPDNELNGITLSAVGRGTTVEFVEALYGNDDGFEFFGGTVNLRYALSLGNADDSFDWTFGWSGFGQFWVAQQDSFNGDRAIEGDNNEDLTDAMPFSQPVLSNLTLLGTEDGDSENIGVKLRNGTKGTIYNAIVTNFASHGVDVGQTSQPFIATQELTLSHSRVFDNNTSGNSDIEFNNAEEFALNDSNQFTAEPSLQGFVGIEPGLGLDPATIDDWFISVNYIGAVDPNNNWTTSWPILLR